MSIMIDITNSQSSASHRENEKNEDRIPILSICIPTYQRRAYIDRT
ncbi:MAG: hypothetical protein AB1391_02465 [Candidatus Micrarchaeota archaeon]